MQVDTQVHRHNGKPEYRRLFIKAIGERRSRRGDVGNGLHLANGHACLFPDLATLPLTRMYARMHSTRLFHLPHCHHCLQKTAVNKPQRFSNPPLPFQSRLRLKVCLPEALRVCSRVQVAAKRQSALAPALVPVLALRTGLPPAPLPSP